MTDFQSGTQQTVFDVALMHYGDIEGLRWLLEDNPTLLKADGTFDQFRKTHRIRPKAALNERLKNEMKLIWPVSGGGENPAAWVTDDGKLWATDLEKTWITDPS